MTIRQHCNPERAGGTCYSGLMSSESCDVFSCIPFPDRPAGIEVDHMYRVEIPRARKRILGRVLIAGTVLVSPLAIGARLYTNNDWLHTRDDDGLIIEDVEGCEPFTTLPVEEFVAPESHATGGSTSAAPLQPLLAIELKHIDTKSAAQNFKPERFNLLKASEQWIEILRHEQVDFRSEISGLRFRLFSDTDNAFTDINTQAIDELVHAILDPRLNYEHPGMQEFVDCMRWRFIDPRGPRELEDRTLNIYIPSNWSVCFKDGLIQHKPKQTEKDYCDSIGATKADIDLSIVSMDWSVIMGTRYDKADAEAQLSQMLIHEVSGHYLPQVAGQVFKWHPNEGAADEFESQVITQLFHDTPIPRILAYAQDKQP